MKRFSIATVLLATSLFGHGINSAFEEGKTEGYLRVGVQSHDQQSSNTDVAAGGKLKFLTGAVSGLHLGVGFYTSHGLTTKHNNGVPFYDNDNQSYSLLGEIYLGGDYQNTTLIVGRQILDTPFADSDDIGMIPNFFEAYTIINNNLQDTTLLVSHILKMAGVDAENPSVFTKLNGSKGMQVIGAIYEGIEDVNLEGWIYHVSNNVDLLYLASSYTGKYAQGNYTVALQYAVQDYKDDSRADVAGIMGEISHDVSGISLSVAYNKTNSQKDRTADNFFGGGPFFTSSEHLTIAEAGVNGEAYIAAISWDGGKSFMSGLCLNLSRLQVSSDRADAFETDMTISYMPHENLSFDLIYSDIRDKKVEDESFKNLRFFANYNF